MHFGFTLDSSDIDLWNIDLLDTYLDQIQISSVNILFVSKTSWRRLQDMLSRRPQDISSRRLQDMSSRRLEDVFSAIIFCLPRHLQDVFKMSSRPLARRKIVMLKTCWRRLQDMSWRCLQRPLKDQQMFSGIGPVNN